MGGLCNRPKSKDNIQINDKNTIVLKGEICASWGYNQRVSQIDGFTKYLISQGKKVNIDYEAKDGGNGEFFLFQIINGEKNAIFSNNKESHGNTAIIGFSIKSDKYADIMSKIK